ncbi:MAG: Molybdate/tungstate transport system permease protein WtpB [Candidatus Heimdallarchaeota archaeon AB_125]|nr:MAG: Molybdate/tungstate transport system permease protein WtpB [Candidatus Heimdallarchaeota archaeon AB_125]
MASSSKKTNKEGKEKKRRSVIDFLYVKLLREPSTNFIIVLVAFVFIVWMVIPLFSVLSGAVYFNGQWSGAPIANVFGNPTFFNFPGDNQTQFFSKDKEDLGGPSAAVTVDNNIAFIAERGDGIEILDVSQPNETTEIRQYFEEVSTFEELVIKDDLLYAAAGTSGLVIFNISDVRESFAPMCHMYGIANTSVFIAVEDNLAILDIDGKGFAIIDVTDPTNPTILSNVTVATDVFDVYIDNDMVYVIGFTTGVVIYDISDPENPSQVAHYTDDPGIGTLQTQDIEIVGDLAYITLGNNGLGIFNITDPQNMTLVEYYDETVVGKLYDVQIVNNYGYFISLDYTSNELGVTIFDISNSSDLVSINSYYTAIFKTADFFIDTTRNLIFLSQLKGGTHILDTSQILIDLPLIAEYEDTQEITVITLSGKDHGVVLNTIILGVMTTIFSVILGTALAFILARYEFPGKKLVSVLALAPLIIPPFISGMGFRLMLGPNGFLNNFLLIPVFGTKLIFSGLFAIIFVQVSHFYALVYLNAFSSFLNIDPSMEESAENLGAGKLRLFSSVTLPLAMPGIGAGAILVLILAMEDVGTPIIFAAMGDNGAKKFLPYYVFENYSKAGSATITPEVCVLGGILLIIALIGFFAIRKYVSLRTYSMVSKGRAGQYRMNKAKWKLFYIYPFLIILFAFSLLVHIGVILMSFLQELGGRKPSDLAFTSENYKAIFVSSKYNIPPYIINTLVYSVLATVLIIIIGSIAAYVVARKDFKGKKILDALVTLPIAIPGIVLAIGYYRTFDWSGIASRNPSWFNKMMANITAGLKLDPFIGIAVTLLIMSYTVRKIPFTVRSAYAGLQQVDEVLEEASFNLGASRMKTFTRITVPLISLNVFAGSLVSFLYCLSEVSTTIFLIFASKAGTITWYMAWNPLKFQIFCAIGVLLMLLQITSLFITNVILGSRAEAITGI